MKYSNYFFIYFILTESVLASYKEDEGSILSQQKISTSLSRSIEKDNLYFSAPSSSTQKRSFKPLKYISRDHSPKTPRTSKVKSERKQNIYLEVGANLESEEDTQAVDSVSKNMLRNNIEENNSYFSAPSSPTQKRSFKPLKYISGDYSPRMPRKSKVKSERKQNIYLGAGANLGSRLIDSTVLETSDIFAMIQDNVQDLPPSLPEENNIIQEAEANLESRADESTVLEKLDISALIQDTDQDPLPFLLEENHIIQGAEVLEAGANLESQADELTVLEKLDISALIQDTDQDPLPFLLEENHIIPEGEVLETEATLGSRVDESTVLERSDLLALIQDTDQDPLPSLPEENNIIQEAAILEAGANLESRADESTVLETSDIFALIQDTDQDPLPFLPEENNIIPEGEILETEATLGSQADESTILETSDILALIQDTDQDPLPSLPEENNIIPEGEVLEAEATLGSQADESTVLARSDILALIQDPGQDLLSFLPEEYNIIQGAEVLEAEANLENRADGSTVLETSDILTNSIKENKEISQEVDQREFDPLHSPMILKGVHPLLFKKENNVFLHVKRLLFSKNQSDKREKVLVSYDKSHNSKNILYLYEQNNGKRASNCINSKNKNFQKCSGKENNYQIEQKKNSEEDEKKFTRTYLVQKDKSSCSLENRRKELGRIKRGLKRRLRVRKPLIWYCHMDLTGTVKSR